MSKAAMTALAAERELVIELIGSLSPTEWAAPSDCVG